jgi:hypothetical protein
MSTYPAGTPAPLTAQFFQYPAGPGQDVDGLTLTVTRLVDSTIVVGPAGSGFTHPATGVYVYVWTIPADAEGGDYIAVWDGTVGGNPVQAADTFGVGAADFTADPATAVGMVRLLINDVDPVAPCFTDSDISAFLTFEAGNVRRAAAQALDTMASNEALVSKVIRTQDLQTDGAKVAAELRARAASLRQQAGDFTADGELFGMDVVDYRPDLWAVGRAATDPYWTD